MHLYFINCVFCYPNVAEELPVDASYGSSFTSPDVIPPRDPEKADMRIVESAAKDVSKLNGCHFIYRSLKQLMFFFPSGVDEPSTVAR